MKKAGIFTAHRADTKTISIGSAWSLKTLFNDIKCDCLDPQICDCEPSVPPLPHAPYRYVTRGYLSSPKPNLLVTIRHHSNDAFYYSFITKNLNEAWREIDRLNEKYMDKRAQRLHSGDTRDFGYYIDENDSVDSKWNALAIANYRQWVSNQIQ